MGEKQLNFNAPLLSVRRISSKLAPSNEGSRRSISTPPSIRQDSVPSNQSDWDLGDLGKPAAVPFMWEQIPGRAKADDDSQIHLPKELPIIPRLASQLVLNSKRHTSGERSYDRYVRKSQIEAQSSSPMSDHANLLCMLNEDLNKNESSELESGDDVFSDALETFSPAQSFSLKCSISAVSDNGTQDLKSSRDFDFDDQARDFMMSRFLPAAKAMVLETPQNLSKKKPLVIQPPLQLKKKVTKEKQQPHSSQPNTKLIPHYVQHPEDTESDEDEGIDVIGKKITKICGFFPKLCVKNSLCLLNPVPRMKLRAKTPVSPVCEVRRPTKTSYSGPLFTQHPSDGNHKKKFHSGVLSREMFEREYKKTGESYQQVSLKKDISPFQRNSKSACVSPFRRQASQTPFHNGAKNLPTAKKVENFRSNKFSSFRERSMNPPNVSSQLQRFKQVSGPMYPPAEKTLYVDPGSKIQHSLSLSRSVASQVPKFENYASKISEKDAALIDEVDEIQDFDKMPVSLEHSKGNPIGSLDMIKANENSTQDNKELTICSSFKSPLNPPLPKSPSESWLWRTLPSIPLRYPSLNPRNDSNSSAEKTDQKLSTDKWEIVVRTNNVEMDNV